MTTDYYIYAYVDPATDTPFYIGAGHNGRDVSHLTCAKNNRQHHNLFLMNKIKKLLRQGIKPGIHRILTGLTRDEAFKIWEPFFIGAIGRRDLDTGTLCNLTNGGEGGTNFGPETKARMSANMKINWTQPEFKATVFAGIAKPETTEARSKAHRKLSPKGKYKGIYCSRENKWKARIKVAPGGKYLYLGTFNTPEEAAQAYNDAVDLYWGGNGWKNLV